MLVTSNNALVGDFITFPTQPEEPHVNYRIVYYSLNLTLVRLVLALKGTSINTTQREGLDVSTAAETDLGAEHCKGRKKGQGYPNGGKVL